MLQRDIFAHHADVGVGEAPKGKQWKTNQGMQKVAGFLDFIKQLKISKPLRKCKLATFYKYPLHTRKRFAPKVDGR